MLMMTRTIFLFALRAFLFGASAAFLALSALRFLPESWLRERWEPPVPRILPSLRVRVSASLGTGALSALPVLFLSDGLRVPPAGLPLPAALSFVLSAVLIQIAAVDLARRVIPDPHLLGIALIGVLALFPSPADTFPAAARFALSAGVLTLPAALPALFGRPAPLGLGDVKLFAALAFLLGALRPSGDRLSAEDLLPVFSFLLCAFLLNGLFALIALLLRKTKLTGALPMAPAVILAFLIAIAV